MGRWSSWEAAKSFSMGITLSEPVDFSLLWLFSLSVTCNFLTPWTVAYHSPLSMGFPKWQPRSRLPFASSGNLPNAGIDLLSPALYTDSKSLNHLIDSPKSNFFHQKLIFIHNLAITQDIRFRPQYSCTQWTKVWRVIN